MASYVAPCLTGPLTSRHAADGEAWGPLTQPGTCQTHCPQGTMCVPPPVLSMAPHTGVKTKWRASPHPLGDKYLLCQPPRPQTTVTDRHEAGSPGSAAGRPPAAGVCQSRLSVSSVVPQFWVYVPVHVPREGKQRMCPRGITQSLGIVAMCQREPKARSEKTSHRCSVNKRLKQPRCLLTSERTHRIWPRRQG